LRRRYGAEHGIPHRVDRVLSFPSNGARTHRSDAINDFIRWAIEKVVALLLPSAIDGERRLAV